MGQECQRCNVFQIREEFTIKEMDEGIGDDSPDIESSMMDEDHKKHNQPPSLKERAIGSRFRLGKEEYYFQDDVKLAQTTEQKEMALTEEQRGEEMSLADGSKYIGNIVDGKANGKGTAWLPNGDMYEGEFRNNIMQGVGIYTYNRGPVYTGPFENGKPNGLGKETWPDGSLYEGQFKDGKKHGKGIYKWIQGCTYNGEWIDNMINGFGRYEWPDGSLILGSGLRIKCMVEANMHGVMANIMMENMKMTKNVDLGYLFGQMGNNIKEIGWRVNNMERESLLIRKEKRNMGNGQRENQLVVLMTQIFKLFLIIGLRRTDLKFCIFITICWQPMSINYFQLEIIDFHIILQIIQDLQKIINQIMLPTNDVPLEFNKDDDEMRCYPSQSGSTATPTLYENTNAAKIFGAQLFEDQLHQDDDEFDEINQQLNKVLLSDTLKPAIVQAFEADMSSYLSHEKLTKNSRKMQVEYQNANLKEKEAIFNTYILNDIENLSLDKYKHYILEKIIETGPPAHRNTILDRIFNQKYKLIRDLYACKVMQKGLEIITQYPQESPVQFENYLNFIHQDNNQMKKVYIDKIANQIVQKSLEVLEGNNLVKLLQILSQYILNYNQDNFELSTDQYGCLIVNKIIDIYPKQFDIQPKTLCNNIITRAIENCSCLTRRQYANYIIQQILEKGQEIHKRLLMDQYLIKDFISMSMDKFGSNVAEKAIVYAGPQWRVRLWEEEIAKSDSSFKKLVNDQFANYPVQKLYEYLDQEQRNEYIALLNKLGTQLNHHGQIVLKYAVANYNIKRYAQKVVQTEFSKNKQKNQEKSKQPTNQKPQKQSQQQQQLLMQLQMQQQLQYQQMQQQQMQQQMQMPQMNPIDYQQYQMMHQMLLYQQQQQQQLFSQVQYQDYMQYPVMNQEQQLMMLRWFQQQQQFCNSNVNFQNGKMK